MKRTRVETQHALLEERRLRNRRQEQLLKFTACVGTLWMMGVVLVANPEWFVPVKKGLSKDALVGYLLLAEGTHQAEFEGATVTVTLDVDGVDPAATVETARRSSFVQDAHACTQYEAEPIIMEAAACPDTVLSTLMFAGTVEVTWQPARGDAVVYEGQLTRGELMTITGGFSRNGKVRLEAADGGRSFQIELHTHTRHQETMVYEVSLFSFEEDGRRVRHGQPLVPKQFWFSTSEQAGRR